MSSPSERRKVKEVGDVRRLTVEDIVYLIHREGDVVQIAELVNELCQRGLSLSEIARATGWSVQKVSYISRIASLPEEVKEMYRRGLLSKTALYKLVRLPPDKVLEAAKRAVEGGGGTKTVEEVVRKEVYIPSLEEALKRSFSPPVLDTRRLLESAQRALEEALPFVGAEAARHVLVALDAVKKALERL